MSETIQTTVQGLLSMEDVVLSRDKNTIFLKDDENIKVLAKFKDGGKTKIPPKISKIKISKKNKTPNLLIPKKWRPDKKTSLKISLGKGTCIIVTKK